MIATGADTKYPIKTGSAIPSLNDVSVQGFPQFDTSVPDIYKTEIWRKDFRKNGPANLNMFWLSNDHTGGPTSAPAAVADNDVALGKLVDMVSHSKYWPETAIFVVEDDSQAASDHVDGHRAPVQIISPWANHGVVDNHYGSQITMLRTVEQILGIQPMNQKDTAASPMSRAFPPHADFTPYNAVPNQVALTDGLKTMPECGADVPAQPAQTTTAVPADKQQLAAQWADWKAQQQANGTADKVDAFNPAQLNHLGWYEAAKLVNQGVEATFAESDATAHKGPGGKLHVTYDIARQFAGYGEKAGASSSAFADRIVQHL